MISIWKLNWVHYNLYFLRHYRVCYNSEFQKLNYNEYRTSRLSQAGEFAITRAGSRA